MAEYKLLTGEQSFREDDSIHDCCVWGDFNDDLERMVKAGWEPHGQLVVTMVPAAIQNSLIHIVHSQMMVRYERPVVKG